MKLAAKQIKDINNGTIHQYRLKEELDKIDDEIEKESNNFDVNT